jgi:hypothetical protein
VIPTVNIPPGALDPLPTCAPADPRDSEEEDFESGWFRDVWSLGTVKIGEVEEFVRYEQRVLPKLDAAAHSASDFEAFALALEDGEVDHLSVSQRETFDAVRLFDLAPQPDDPVLLGGLELGVAGLSYALCAAGCPTVASCRSHWDGLSWSDCPVVFFVAKQSWLQPLATLIVRNGCSLDSDRGCLKICGPSVVNTHSLAVQILTERCRIASHQAC